MSGNVNILIALLSYLNNTRLEDHQMNYSQQLSVSRFVITFPLRKLINVIGSIMLEIAKRSYNNRAKNILFCHILLTGIRDET